MRWISLLGLCVLLTACATQAATEESPVLSGSSSKTARQATISETLDSTMPLYVWNDAGRRYEIHLIDLATGQDVPGKPAFIVSEHTEFTGSNTLSTDGQQLAIVAANGEYCYPSGGGTACMARADVLYMIDRRAWHEVTATLPGKGWARPMSFSSDGKHLAMIFNEPKSSTVMLFDTSTGNRIAQQEIAFQPSILGYIEAGATLALYGQPLGPNPGISKPDPPRVVLMDATTLEVKWEQKLPNVVSGFWCLEKCDASHAEQTFAEWTPAVILSPERERLYIVHADEQQLTNVDFGARTVHTTGIQATKSLFDKLLASTAGVAKAKGIANGAFKAGVLSPDGMRLYVIGQMMSSSPESNNEEQETNKSLGVEVIDVDSGQRLLHADSEATWIKITPDGKHLLLGSWGKEGIDVLDAASLRSVANLGQWDLVTTLGVNGQTMILASRSGQSLTQLAILDPTNFDPSRSWSLKTSYASWLSTP